MAMSTAAPVGFAAVGGIAGSYFGMGALGASVGWMLGSWLFPPETGEKNEIIDPGAQELPAPNQALRGATIPVLYGTNRVPSNIVLRKNFTQERHEARQSEGGGKGGGSGGGKAVESDPGAGATYTYKLDAIAHLGFAGGGRQFGLIGGWNGGERISGDTLALINNIDGSITNDLNPANAGYRFDEAFFYDGVNSEGWEHGQTLTDSLPVRWPNTTWVGFKQLRLGSRPIMPQMNWEVGPAGEVTFDIDPVSFTAAFSATDDFNSPGLANADHQAARGTDKFGNAIWTQNGNGDVAAAVNRNGDKIWTVTRSSLLSSLETFIGSQEQLFVARLHAWPVANGEKIAVGLQARTAGRNYYYIAIHPAVETGGLEMNGFVRMNRLGVQLIKSPYVMLTMGGQGITDDLILLSVDGTANSTFRFYKFPSASMIENGTWETFSGAPDFEVPHVGVTIPSDMQNFWANPSNAGAFGVPGAYSGFTVPYLTGSLSLGTKLVFYQGKANVDGTVNKNNYVSNSLEAIYPRGMTVEWDITNVIPISPTSDTPSITASLDYPTIVGSDRYIDFLFGSAAKAPFFDDGVSIVGSVDDNAYWSPRPTVQKLLNGSYLVAYQKTSNIANDTLNGGFLRQGFRFYIYSPIDQTYNQIADGHGFVFANSHWSANGSDGWQNEDAQIYYDETITSGNNLWVHGLLGSTANDEVNTPGPWVSQLGFLNFGGEATDEVPPFIIRDIMTSPIYGVGVKSGDIHLDSYTAAVNYCVQNSIYVSTMYRREDSASKIIDQLLAVYGGFLTITNGTKVKFGTMSAPETVVRTLTDNDFAVDREGDLPINVIEGSIQDTINYVKVNYFDRSLEYKQNFVEVQDDYDVEINGRRPAEFPPQFVMSERTASRMAENSMWQNLYARRQIAGAVTFKNCDLEPGDTVHLVSSSHPFVSDGIRARIVTKSETRKGFFKLALIEEAPYLDEITGVSDGETDASSNPLLGTPRPAQEFTAYELPKLFQGSNPSLYINWLSGGTNTAGAKLYISPDGVSFAQAMNVSPYPIAGRLAQGLGSGEGVEFEENVELYVMPGSGFNVSSPTFVATLALDDVGPAGRAAGAGNIWIGSEMLAFEGLNLLAQNRYRVDRLYRGWGGTHKNAHSSGDVWYKHGGGIFIQGYNENNIGNIIHYKVVPFNFAGVEYNVSSVDPRTYQIQGTYFSPQIAPTIHPWVGSTDYRGANVFGVDSGDALHFEWQDASRMSGFGVGGFGVGGFGRFTTDTTSHQWEVVVTGSGGNVVQSLVVNTWAYGYTRSANIADNGGFFGGVAIRVWPFNASGYATRYTVRTMDIFER